MSSLLVVRPSSLGDIVYALALVSDVVNHDPDMTIDWVAEEAFVPLVRLDSRVRRVVPIAFRRWRRSPLAAATWRELARFHRELRERTYTVVLDMQEQVKGALVARMADGERHGFDRHSIREPLASLFDDVHHAVPRNIHFVDKCRALCGAALGYAVVGQPRWNLTLPAPAASTPATRYAVAFHSTSRADKLWPEDLWRSLFARFAQQGMVTLVPWGSADERARSQRLAADTPSTIVPERQTLPDLAALVETADLVVGVDTGLTHLAAVIGTPTVAVFTVTDPRLAGVAQTGPHAIDVGGSGNIPTLDEVIDAAVTAGRGLP